LGEVRPPVDDLANMPGRERLVELLIGQFI